MRGDTANNLNLKARHSRHDDGFGSSIDHHGREDMPSKEPQCNYKDDSWRETAEHRSRKCARLSSSPKSHKSHCPTSSFHENLAPDDGPLFEEKDNPLNTISDFHAFCQASKKELDSSVEDLMGSFSVLDGGFPKGFSPPGGSHSEKFTFRRTSSFIHSHSSPTTSKVDLGSRKPDITASHSMEGMPSAQDMFCEDEENTSKLGAMTGKKSNIERGQCAGNNCASSENGESIDTRDSRNVIELKETVDETPEVIESPKTGYSPSNAIESLLPLEIPKSESIVPKEYVKLP